MIDTVTNSKYVKEDKLRFIYESDQNCFHLEIYQ